MEDELGPCAQCGGERWLPGLIDGDWIRCRYCYDGTSRLACLLSRHHLHELWKMPDATINGVPSDSYQVWWKVSRMIDGREWTVFQQLPAEIDHQEAAQPLALLLGAMLFKRLPYLDD